MERPLTGHQVEVIDQLSSAVHGLGPHPRRSTTKVSGPEAGDQPAGIGGEPPTADRPDQLGEPRPPVADHEPGCPAPYQRGGQVTDRDVGPAIALPSQGQHGVGAGVDAAVEASGEVHAEERKPGIGNRVDQTPDQVGRRPNHVQVLAPEGQDAGVGSRARASGHPVCMEPGAPHQETGPERAVRRVDQPATSGWRGPPSPYPGPDLSTRHRDHPGKGSGHGGEVGPASGRDVQGSHAGHVGLVFGRRAGRELGDRHPVGPGPFDQGGQPGSLVFRRCHDQLPATVVGDAVLGAELDHPVPAPYGQVGLERTGRVVEAGVDNPAVAARLVGGDRGLLLEHHHRDVGQAADQGVGCGQAEDSATHHDHVGPGVGGGDHGPTLPVARNRAGRRKTRMLRFRSAMSRTERYRSGSARWPVEVGRDRGLAAGQGDEGVDVL